MAAVTNNHTLDVKCLEVTVSNGFHGAKIEVSAELHSFLETRGENHLLEAPLIL